MRRHIIGYLVRIVNEMDRQLIVTHIDFSNRCMQYDFKIKLF
jgi:hypothetical protein